MKTSVLSSCVAACVAYKAAYVEHMAASPCGQGSCGKEQNAASVKAYESYASTASQQGAQIIVFPEYGITGFSSYPKSAWYQGGYTETIPTPKGQVPCDSANEFSQAPSVVSLSCSARKHSIAIVANLMEYAGGKMYNTDVAIDTDGSFLAKYHKRNLWGETNVDTPPLEKVTFTTKFGTTFGMITCADLIYNHPALDLVEQGVKDFVMPLAWSNEMAQMQALAYAQGWTIANNVNLILANHRTSSESGSAILVSGTPVSQYYSPGRSAGPVQVGDLSAGYSLPPASEPFRLPFARLNLTDLSAEENWKFGSVDGSQTCSGPICCTAKSAGSSSGYALAVLDGRDSDDGVTWPAHVCAVVPCRNGRNCLSFQQPSGSMKSVEVTMTGSNAASVVPEVLATGSGGEKLLTPGKKGLSFTSSQGSATVSANSASTLISAIVYGRPFASDATSALVV